MNAMEIVEHDELDKTIGKKKAPAAKETSITEIDKEKLIKFAAAKGIKENVLRILCSREYKKELDDFTNEECAAFCNLIEERGGNK